MAVTREFEKIGIIARQLGAPSARVEIGIGDDAAVVRPAKNKMLLCSDAMVESIHFDLAFISAVEIGRKALATCLSDIAAMNGTPLYALVSLAVPERLNQTDFLNEFYRGLSSLARECKVDVVGGDLSSSPADLFVDISIVGETANPYTRSGAGPGDLIAVSGYPGTSAAGLQALKQKESVTIATVLRQAHLCPIPRFDLLPELNKINGLCTSMIDISDGVSSELHHIAKASGVGFEIDAALLPMRPEVLAEAGSREAAVDFALSGGEDYELLATFKPNLWTSPAGWTVIGVITPASRGTNIKTLSGKTETLVATGYNHFKSLQG